MNMFRFRLFAGGTRKLPVSERLRSLIGVSKSQLARNTFWLSMNSIINMAISVVVVQGPGKVVADVTGVTGVGSACRAGEATRPR